MHTYIGHTKRFQHFSLRFNGSRILKTEQKQRLGRFGPNELHFTAAAERDGRRLFRQGVAGPAPRHRISPLLWHTFGQQWRQRWPDQLRVMWVSAAGEMTANGAMRPLQVLLVGRDGKKWNRHNPIPGGH